MPSESTHEQLIPHIKEFSTTTQQFWDLRFLFRKPIKIEVLGSALGTMSREKITTGQPK
jgi:hypothetical protein